MYLKRKLQIVLLFYFIFLCIIILVQCSINAVWLLPKSAISDTICFLSVTVVCLREIMNTFFFRVVTNLLHVNSVNAWLFLSPDKYFTTGLSSRIVLHLNVSRSSVLLLLQCSVQL